MQIEIDPSVLKEARWQEFAIRFLSGGLITAATGLIARKFGPVIGGLFLAYPAIFPASATLIEKHEEEKKEEEGLNGTMRGRAIAAVDAAGAAMGSFGLFLFGLLVWHFIPSHRPWLVLLAATFAWLAVSILIWLIRKRI
jgi:Protein of unknown function (DUF3147)